MKTISEYVSNNNYIDSKRFFIDDILIELIEKNYTRKDCIFDIVKEINYYTELEQFIVVNNLSNILINVISGDFFNREIINDMFNSQFVMSDSLEEFRRRVYKEKDKNPINAIYKITCTANESIYIGSTSDLIKRKIIHQYTLKFGFHHNRNLQADYIKHGSDCFTYEIMYRADKNIDRAELYLLEQIYIDKYNPEYNIIKEGVAFSGKKNKN